MNSILHKELIGLSDSVNYWLAIGWLIAILGALIAIATLKVKKSTKKRAPLEDQRIRTDRNSGKGF